jgi:hypothetical protein
MKNEGLPEGFVMDERISQLASTPINISSHKEQQAPYEISIRYEFCVGWLDFLNKYAQMFENAPLTFGTTFA